MKTVLCYGDSNTWGYDPDKYFERYGEDIRWPCVLGRMLGDGYRVVEEGLNGRTTAYDRPDGKWKNGLTYLTPCIGSHFPLDWIVFMLGSNDTNNDLGLSPEKICKGMDKAVRTARGMSQIIQGYVPKILVIVPPAVGPDYAVSPFAQYTDATSKEKSEAIAPLYREMAEKRGCFFLDCSGLEVSKRDSIHMVPESHRRLAEMVYGVISNDE